MCGLFLLFFPLYSINILNELELVYEISGGERSSSLVFNLKNVF